MLLVFALPIVFMLHDFEEIIFLRPWLERNGDRLRKSLPKAAGKMLAQMRTTTTERFSLIVAEEFVIVSGVTFYSVTSGNYYPWFALLLGFSAHFAMHIAQWLFVRRYIPAIATTLLALPYCYFAIIRSVGRLELTAREVMLCLVSGVVVVGLNLFVMHYLTGRVPYRSE